MRAGGGGAAGWPRPRRATPTRRSTRSSVNGVTATHTETTLPEPVRALIDFVRERPERQDGFELPAPALDRLERAVRVAAPLRPRAGEQAAGAEPGVLEREQVVAGGDARAAVGDDRLVRR